MPRAIEQPARFGDDAGDTMHDRVHAAVERRRPFDEMDPSAATQLPDMTPATAITRLDIPFEDVFLFTLKFMLSQAIIGAIVGAVIWFIVLR